MKRHCFTSYPLFALIGLILLPLAVAHALPPPADHVQKCALFDYEQWRREHPRPAGKALAALNKGEPRTVRMIYFLPNDRPYRVAAVDTIKMRMRQAQDWFAREMGAHGHGNTIVRFEADAAGEPLVHRVDGQHSTEHYNNQYTVDKVLDEIDPVFDFAENVYYIAIDNGNSAIYNGDRLVGGVGSSWSKNGGWGMVPISASFGTVAHELGHAFDLWHDFRDDDYVMSYGYVPEWLLANQRLSACNAEFLAVHTYFNPNSPIEDGSRPTIQENTSSPIRISAGTTSIPVRIKGRDPDGLHQAILFTRTQAPHFAVGSFEVKACRGLEGKRNPVVEFDYDGFAPSRPGSDFNTFETQSLRIEVVDALGNTEWSDLLEIINPEFKKPIATFPIPSDPKFLRSIVFSPDGKLLALESSRKDDKVTLRDVSTGKSIANLPPYDHVVEAWALSPDGRLLAFESPNNTIVLWDIPSRKQHVATAPAHRQDEEFPWMKATLALAFSPDGRLLASGGNVDYLVKLWDVVSGEHVATFPALAFGGGITSLAFSPDGKRLAAYDAGGTVRLWDVASREHVATIDAHENGSWANSKEVAFSPDGRLLATGGTRWTSFEVEETSEVKLWNVSTGKPISATLFGSAPVAFSPDGRLLATGSGIETKWFDLDGLEGGTRQGENYGGDAVTLWEVSTGEPIAILPPWSRIYDLAFSPGGKRLVEMTDKAVRLWDPAEWIGEQTITIGELAVPHSLAKVSGDRQEGQAGAALAKPFVVSVKDQNGSVLAGAVVFFSVTAGGGTLSPTTAETRANGQARSFLLLGPDPGTNTVTAKVAGLEPVTFTAIGQTTTDSDSEEDDSEEDDGEDQQESEETPTSTVELKGISSSHDSVRENDAQATTITLTVTLDKAARTDETITLAIVSPTQGKTAKRGEDFDATLDETITIAKGQRTGTAQLILTPKDNTTAEGDKAFAVQATSSSGHAALINIKIIDNDSASEPQAWLTPDPAEVEFSANDPAWKTFIVHTNLDSVLVRANPPGSDPAIEVSGGQQVPTRDYCPAEGNDRPTSGRRDGWNLHVKACQAGQTKILLIDYDTDTVLQQYEVNVEASTSAAASTALNPSYPNPFNSETVLSYSLPTAADIRLEVFTLSGQRVAVLHEGFQAAGYHTIAMDARDLASGVYLYRLTTPEGRFVQKFTLLR